FRLPAPAPPGATLFPYTTLFRSAFLRAVRRALQNPSHFAHSCEPCTASSTSAPARTRSVVHGSAPHTAERAAVSGCRAPPAFVSDRKSTRLNSSHVKRSYAVSRL